MTLFSKTLALLLIPCLLWQSMARADTCTDCFTQSRAAYYPNSGQQGTDWCMRVRQIWRNGGDVSAASNLYRDGVGCVACYQVRCSNAKYCSNNGVTIGRVSCIYPSKNITFKIDHSSSNPYYFAFQIWYQAISKGNKDVIAIQLCETENLTCKRLERSHGAVWAVSSPPRGPLSARMLLSGVDVGDETWVVGLVAPIDIPQDWTAGAIYDSGIQV